MRALVESLQLSCVPFVHFDAGGTPVHLSPEARLLLGAHVERGLDCLSREAHRLLAAGIELAAPREFFLRGCGLPLRVGAVAMLAAAGRVEVLMVLSLAHRSPEAMHAPEDEPSPSAAGDVPAPTRSPLRRYFDSRQLTDRERQVAEHIATGLPSPAIAGILGISVHTVRRHTERVFTKTGARSRSGLARLIAELYNDSNTAASGYSRAG